MQGAVFVACECPECFSNEKEGCAAPGPHFFEIAPDGSHTKGTMFGGWRLWGSALGYFSQREVQTIGESRAIQLGVYLHRTLALSSICCKALNQPDSNDNLPSRHFFIPLGSLSSASWATDIG